MANPKTKEWEEVLDLLDLEKVSYEIDQVEEGQPDMPDYERQDVRRLVLIAAERWLPQDLEEWKVIEVEKANQTDRFKWITDIRGTHRGRFNSYAEYEGVGFIADWKTTRGELNADWAKRYKYSWQWPLYCAQYPEVKLFHYRGVSRTGDTRTIVIDVPASKAIESEKYLDQTYRLRDQLKGEAPWPRKMPGSCKAYGRDCEFFESVCSENKVIEAEFDFSRPLSYSSSETFYLCPEKHRLTQISGYGEDDETLAFGKSFHRGIAEVYRQAYKLEV